MNDELIENVVADYKRISYEQGNHSFPQEEGLKEIAWSREYNRREESIDDKVVPLSKRLPKNIDTRSFTPISEWEGYVEDIGEEEFTVRMIDVKSHSSVPEDIATFTKNDLSQLQRSLLVPGAIVRWVVGLERLPTDQRRRVSELHFRNLPAHSTCDLERARREAEALLNSIHWDEGS